MLTHSFTWEPSYDYAPPNTGESLLRTICILSVAQHIYKLLLIAVFIIKAD